MDTTAPQAPAANPIAVEGFLNRVLPTGQAAYVVEYEMPPKPGQSRKFHSFKSFPSVRDAAKFAVWATNKGADVWHSCAGFQALPADPKTNVRHLSEMTVSQAFYFDLDIKHPLKKKPELCYDTVQEAMAHFVGFVQVYKLPRLSLIVGSGNGLHVYWVLDTPLTLQSWRPIAAALAHMGHQYGLKADFSVTMNGVSLLRPPGSINFKYPDAPRLVNVVGQSPSNVPVEMMRAAVTPFLASVVASTPTPAGTATAAAGGLNSDLFKQYDRRPALTDPILDRCEVMKHAAETGGADYGYDLWRKGVLALLATCDDGHMFVHELSNGYPSYTVDETDRQWQDAQRFIAGGGKPPTCEAIALWGGSEKCGTCQFNGKIPTPRALGEPQFQDQESRDAPPEDALPFGYVRRNGRIYKIDMSVPAEDSTGEAEPIMTPITSFDVRNMKAWRSLEDQDWLVEFDRVDGSGTRRIHFLYTEIEIKQRDKANRFWASKQTIVFHPEKFGALLMAWVDQLHQAKLIPERRARKYGWVADGKENLIGFSTGGTVYLGDGNTEPSIVQDPVLQQKYREVGDKAVWSKVAQNYINQSTAGTQAIIAASFASPLAKFTGQQGLLLVATSEASGTGKSTAIKIGQAVWGHPRYTCNLDDTINAVSKVMGVLGNLPAYWDEVRLKENADKFVDMVFRIGQGRDKQRLDATSRLKDTQAWESVLVVASNISIMERVVANVGASDAGMNRVFEWDIPLAEVEAARRGGITPAQMAVEMYGLERNYGGVGVEYAKWLAANATGLEKLVPEAVDKEITRYGLDASMRYWGSACALVRLGSRIANKLGYCKFDLTGIDTFLDETMHALLAGKADKNQGTLIGGEDSDLESIISDFVNDHILHLLITNVMSLGGKPGMINVIRSPGTNKEVKVHASEDGLLRVSRRDFEAYIQVKKRMTFRNVMTGLEEKLGAVQGRKTLGGGTIFRTAQVTAIDIPLKSAALRAIVEDENMPKLTV